MRSLPLVYFLPLAASALAALAGRALGGLQGPRGWCIGTGVVAAISLAVGLIAYGGHAGDVSAGRAVAGGALATGVSAVVLGLYFLAGRHLRRGLGLFLLWLASLAPLYYLSFGALIATLAYTQCLPGASECPL